MIYYERINLIIGENMVKQTKDELKTNLKEQIQLLINSCTSFDKGFKVEAKNMAVKIRVILHDARWPSLLTLLGKKDILFYNTALEKDKRNPQPHMGLIELTLGTKGAEYSAPLDKVPSKDLNGKIPFKDWWEKNIVLEDANKNQFTRKDLVLIMCNQDGGAHVDLDLDDKYIDLTRTKSLGWTYYKNGEEKLITEAELASIRQIAHELLKSLKDEFPELFKDLDYSILEIEDISKEPFIKINPTTFSVIEGTDKDLAKKIDFKDSKTKIDIDSLIDYIKSSDTIEYWANVIRSLDIRIGPVGMVYQDLGMLKKTGINTIKELDNLLRKSKGWGEKYFDAYYKILCGDESRKLWSTDRGGIISMLLIANFPDIFTDDVLEYDFGHGNPENATVPAMLYNPRYSEK